MDDLLSSLCTAVDTAVQLMEVRQNPSLQVPDQPVVYGDCSNLFKAVSLILLVTITSSIVVPPLLRFDAEQVNRTDTEPSGHLQWEWVQLSVADSMGDGSRKLPEAEDKTAKRELGVFCSSLLEVHEDELIAAIREGTQTGARRPAAS